MKARKNAARNKAYAENPVVRKRVSQDRAVYRISPAGVKAARLANIWHNYRLTAEQYGAMVEACGSCCEVCSRPLVEGNKKTAPHVDHCHKTGKVRGLLCASCNSGLGHLGDELGRVQRAAAYLLRFQESPSKENGGN